MIPLGSDMGVNMCANPVMFTHINAAPRAAAVTTYTLVAAEKLPLQHAHPALSRLKRRRLGRARVPGREEFV
jgi:hypothetical protein